ncbi:MAG TPA: hypothetical protein VNW25_06780, partial [Candidatus Sulfotelmatobacter sp.]|nr:hypothetical protein [Candidatus Sulfotelmatobacter sp.]
MKSSLYRSSLLIILSLAALWSVPTPKASPGLGTLIPPSFEVNAMAVSAQGDVAAGSFYALDPTVIPWDLTNPIYKYVGVTLIASNINNTALSSATGINVTGAANTLAPYHVVLIIEGVQRNAPAIVSDIQTLFGMAPGSFEAITSSPFTLPVSVFGSNFTSYSSFVSKFVALTSAKSAMIGHYAASLLLQSSSGVVFNSLESITYPVSPAFSLSGIGSAVLGITSIGAAIAPVFGLNSTGVIVIHKKALSFSLPQDHTLSFGSLVGQTNGIYSATNETYVASLPGGAQVKSFSPSNMLVQSSAGTTLVIGVFPWVGTTQRLVPDVSVTFHYPAFDSPVLDASWTTTPSTPDVGQSFTLILKLNNTGPLAATNLHLSLGFSGVVLSSQPNVNGIQYVINALPSLAANTTSFRFQSYRPDDSFTLQADFLDSSSYVYNWQTQFSLAPNVKTSGPLAASKSVSPTNPGYGQIGNVTVTIQNPSGSTFYNVQDLNPDAQAFLYPQGFGNTQQPGPCLSGFYTPFNANTTHFSFGLTNAGGCAPVVLTHVFTQLNAGAMQSAATPNQIIGGGEVWSPVTPYRIPGGIAPPGSILTMTLTFINFVNITETSVPLYPGSLASSGNPRSAYLGLYCLPCAVPRGGATLISGALYNATGSPIIVQPVSLSYEFLNGTRRSLNTATTNATGGFSFNWAGVPQLPLGKYLFVANFTGSAKYNPEGVFLPFAIVTPTTITAGGTLTLFYPYVFNVTGYLNITPERIAYSSAINATGTNHLLQGEYATMSKPVPVTVGAPTIVPVADIWMNVTKVSFLYVAQNQSLVQVNLRVTNTGPQTANNVVVSSLIPQTSGSCFGISPSPAPCVLPVISTGPFISESTDRKTVTFSPGTITPGTNYSSWYIVKANSTNIFETASNVTAQAGSNTFRFYFTGPLLGVYPYPSSTPLALPPIGHLKGYATVDPAFIANKTSTTVSLHLYNAGNVTYTNINATAANFLGSELSIVSASKLVPNMAPGTSQTVNFTGTAAAAGVYFSMGVSTYQLRLSWSYNQSRTIGFNDYISQNVLIYDPTFPGFNPSLRIDITTPTPSVTAGATALVIVTVTNTGSSPVSNFEYQLTSYIPMYNPTGPSPSPAMPSYGSYFNGWFYSLGPGQKVIFRLGIQTSAGGLYPVFAAPNPTIFYNYRTPTGSVLPEGQVEISASSAALITATDTATPTVSAPWSSPFAPTSSDQVHIWTQVYDGSGVSSVNLEYSTDKLSWATAPMTPVYASYVKGQSQFAYVATGQSVPQPFFGDIYAATLPAEGPGAAVFYRIRATDGLSNSGLYDNNGNDYVYFIQGGNSWLFPNQPPGTNVLLNGTQYVPGIKTTITMNVSTPIAVQVIQLSSNPGGSPPPGLSNLGIYTQVNANVSVILNARIRFYYTPSQIQGFNVSSVTPYYWNGASWVALDNVARNPGQNYVEGTVNHFSLFGVFASAPTTTTTQPASISWTIIGAIIAVAAVIIIGGILVEKR